MSTLEASIAPSAPPAPTRVCSSSMKRTTFLARRTSFMTALMRSSNWPRYLVPATIRARSRTTSACRARSRARPVDDLLGEALDDGGLANARLTEQDGVVLRAAAEDLDHPLDLELPPDDGIELALTASSVRSRPKLSSAGVLTLPGLSAGPSSPTPGLVVLIVGCRRRGGSRTSSRTSSSFTPRFSRTWAATPSCSGAGRGAGARSRRSCGSRLPSLLDGVLDAPSWRAGSEAAAHGHHGGRVLTSFSTSRRTLSGRIARFLRTLAATPRPS